MPPMVQLIAVVAAWLALGAAAAPPADAPAAPPRPIPAVRAMGTQLVLSGRPFRAFGFNYHWGQSHPNIDYLRAPSTAGLLRMREDFAEMALLGANTVRLFVPIETVMETAAFARPASLAALRRTLQTAWAAGLRVELTGGTVWEPRRLPPWYDALSEADRWTVDERFWHAVAAVGARAGNVLAYELTSEPVIQNSESWYGGTLNGDHHCYLRIIVRDIGDRDPVALAREWTRRMGAAVHAEDPRGLVTLGLLPALGHAFDPANVADLLDVLTVHVYPDTARHAADVRTLNGFAGYGKPLVVGEVFALDRRATEEFLIAARRRLDGALSFYDGRAVEDVAGAGDADTMYRENLISFLGLRATLRAAP